MEEIKEKEWLEVEEKIRERMNIKVLNDDKNGKEIIVEYEVIKGMEIEGKKIEEEKIVK